MTKRRASRGLTPPDPTFALLLATLRWPDDDRRRSAIVAAASADIDWERLLSLLTRHRVGPLALQGLKSASIAVPDRIGERIDDWQQQALFAELQTATQLVALQNLFRKQDIEPLVLKGPAQSLRSFGRLGLRINRDLDLLVAREDVDGAEKALLGAGYTSSEPPIALAGNARRQWLRDHKDMVFAARTPDIPVELHWRLFDNPALMPVADVPCPVRLDLAPIPDSLVLPDEINLRYLCHHGAQHAWSRLKWLTDVNAFLSRLDATKIRAAYEPRAGRPDHAVGQALLLCHDLLGARLPSDVLIGRFGSRASWLARLAWQQIIRNDTDELEARRFGSTVKNLSHYALNDGWRYWYEELRFDFGVIPRRQGAAEIDGRGRLSGWISRHFAR